MELALGALLLQTALMISVLSSKCPQGSHCFQIKPLVQQHPKTFCSGPESDYRSNVCPALSTHSSCCPPSYLPPLYSASWLSCGSVSHSVVSSHGEEYHLRSPRVPACPICRHQQVFVQLRHSSCWEPASKRCVLALKEAVPWSSRRNLPNLPQDPGTRPLPQAALCTPSTLLACLTPITGAHLLLCP